MYGIRLSERISGRLLWLVVVMAGIMASLPGEAYSRYYNVIEITRFSPIPFAGAYDPYSNQTTYTLSGAGQPGVPDQAALDELYIKLDFMAGQSRMLVRAGISNCLANGDVSEASFHAIENIQGNWLAASYGFYDIENFNGVPMETICSNPNALVQDFTFSVAGNQPIASAMFTATYHYTGGAAMPDLYGDLNRTGTLPFPGSNRLFASPVEADSTVFANGPVVGPTARNIVVLVHGNNYPTSTWPLPAKFRKNNFAPLPGAQTDPLEAKWQGLYNNLLAALPAGWELARYDWSQDASLGYDPFPSRVAALSHGLKLGALLASDGVNQRPLERVHLIAHSAGSWLIARAAQYLKWKFPNIRIELTLLDGFIPDSTYTHYQALSSAADWVESYYVNDLGTLVVSGNNTTPQWNTRPNWPGMDVAVNIGAGGVPLYRGVMMDHGGPVIWYADTAANHIQAVPVAMAYNGRVIGFENAIAIRPSIELLLNASIFDSTVNNQLVLSASSLPGDRTPNSDLYVELALPGGSVRYLTWSGSLSATPVPYVANIVVPVYNGMLLNHLFTGSEPAGKYVFSSSFFVAGTAIRIGAKSEVPFSFAP